MIKKTALLATAILGLTVGIVGNSVNPVLADQIRQEQIRFQPGKSSAVINGTVKGYDSVDYVINVKKGQTMNVSMTSNNSSNYFNILEPGQENEAIFVGSTSGNQFEQVLAKSGNYKIRVYLMRNAARRNETGKYRLETIVN
ncbi:DNA breaking-rejoining protein [Synechocystis salina LEGE 06155]|nr:DNA breaking-rejoining protein [Synechocystis salina LEGE 06155]